MGTRHLTCVVKDGEYKVAQYGQWDGYPEGQGKTVLNFLKNEMNRELFENKISKVSFITSEENQARWVEAGAEPNSQWVSMDVSDKHKKMYPENSRDTGAEILSLIQNSDRPVKLQNDLDFAADSLFCEWCYVVDLDKNTFEVYEGFNQQPLDENERFYGLNYDPEHRTEKYYPVKHVITFSLDCLPTEEEFLNTFKNNEEEE